jgi:hypothetical protein
MKVNSIVLIQIVVFSTFCFANAKAVELTMINPPPVEVKPIEEIEEPSSVLTPLTESSNLQEFEFNYYDSRFNEIDDVNLSFQLKFQPDTINYHDVYFYLKHILPIIKKMNSENIEMIEIL